MKGFMEIYHLMQEVIIDYGKSNYNILNATL